MKTCPFCAEQIQDAAIVCKHCGRELNPEAVRSLETRFGPNVEAAPEIPVGVDASLDTDISKVPRDHLRPIWVIGLTSALVLGSLSALVAYSRASDLIALSEVLGQPVPRAILVWGLPLNFLISSVFWGALTAIIVIAWRLLTNPDWRLAHGIGSTMFTILVMTPIALALGLFALNRFPLVSPRELAEPTNPPSIGVPTITLRTNSVTAAPTSTAVVRANSAFFANWGHPSEGYWYANVDGAHLSVSIDAGRELYEAVWSSGNASAGRAVDQFICDAAEYSKVGCDLGMEIMSRAKPDNPAHATLLEGTSVTSMIVHQDNGSSVARFIVRP